jgi:hypothetical protein
MPTNTVLGITVLQAIDPISKDVITMGFRSLQVTNMQQMNLALPW